MEKQFLDGLVFVCPAVSSPKFQPANKMAKLSLPHSTRTSLVLFPPVTDLHRQSRFVNAGVGNYAAAFTVSSPRHLPQRQQPPLSHCSSTASTYQIFSAPARGLTDASPYQLCSDNCLITTAKFNRSTISVVLFQLRYDVRLLLPAAWTATATAFPYHLSASSLDAEVPSQKQHQRPAARIQSHSSKNPNAN